MAGNQPLGERVIVDQVTDAELRPIRIMPQALGALPPDKLLIDAALGSPHEAGIIEVTSGPDV